MPDKNVQLPDGRVVAFPDSMSDVDIATAIKTHLSPGAAEQAHEQTKQSALALMSKELPDKIPVALSAPMGGGSGFVNEMDPQVLENIQKQNAKSGVTMLTSEGASSLPLLARAGITGLVAGGMEKAGGSSTSDAANIGLLQGALPEIGGAALSATAGKVSSMAGPALARVLRLTPKSVQFGREPAEEVLQRGLASGNLKTIKGSIVDASKQITSDLNDVLKSTKGTINVENQAIDVANQMGGSAGSRFLKVVDDAADKLGIRTNQLSSLSAADTNALKQEVARQSKFVEGDMRPSVANGGKVFGGKLKDEMIKLNPRVQPLLESSANLTEASKGADYAVRAEKVGQGKGLLGGVQLNKPGTYVRAITDRPGAPQMLYSIANSLKDHTSVANALRIAYALAYGGNPSGDENQ